MRTPKLRVLLAMLLVNANKVVSVDYLVAELWGGAPPKGAVNQLHGYVMRLRRQLLCAQSVVLETREPGYQLVVPEAGTDIAVFADRVDRARDAHRAGDLDLAAGLLQQALELWRGSAYADVPGTPSVGVAADRLEEQRLSALELSAEVDLDRGLPDRVITPMRALVSGRQIRERAWFCFMLALYRCGRSADALDAYQTLYERMSGELGLEPGASIRALHSRILRHDGELDTLVCASAPGGGEPAHPAPPNPDRRGQATFTGTGVPVPRQLPVDVWRFTGRADLLAEIEALAANGDGRITAVIDGMPGAGKTALALHAAHRLADRFPDGQLYVNLRGHSPRERAEDPAVVLENMLLALGASAQVIPPGLAERAALYRSRLAGTRTLIVLDNAATEAQVRPLLPATPGCFAVTTSRRRLGGLDEAHHLPVGVLTDAEARLLLAQMIGDGRAADERELAELARLCGQLPLALRIAAMQLNSRPKWTVGYLAARLRDAHDPIGRLRAGDQDLSSSFLLSYERLPARCQDVFRQLGRFPETFTCPEAAELAGLPPAEMDVVLERLTDEHLLEQPGAGRYRLHFLLRRFARSLEKPVVPEALPGG
ncbi:AfsR/SARP family transcriptional regulator [Amycolatopsis sp.]|uniref:AfsR/SARP family transcriptional regulator n=1 Tax=Amycolatopsis sp. TaxID=37632 RepID=UPI002D7E2341|nr:BTAD domain-containing putative transcriptional regulator [Amycolatopsis sp.]HET6706954.1 BTAD domain-containing putative transcriptional regulator [Amycolatopsis sp.]